MRTVGGALKKREREKIQKPQRSARGLFFIGKISAIGAAELFMLGAWGCGADTVSDVGADGSAAAETEIDADISRTEETETAVSGARTENPETDGAGVSQTDGLCTVTFLDVGQGNAVLVETGGEYMLIDGGDRDASSYVVSYLKNEGVETLSYVISSHYDADHLNGVVGALNAFSCELLLDADYETDTKVYASLQNVVAEKDIDEVHPDLGDVYSLGSAEFTVVCPDAYDYDDENNNSIGIRLVYGDTSFLICGDAGSEVEEMMMMSGLALQSDVYLASHHGSAYSSSLAFLEEVAPEAVVISAGRSNSYGHPTKEVLDNIRTVGAKLYRTDLQGEIVAVSDGTAISFQVAATDDFRSGEEIADGAEASETDGADTADENDADASQTDAAADSPDTDDSPESVSQTYILNTNTKKFHLPDCGSVSRIKDENKAAFTGTREELLAEGYSACKNCNP